MHSAAILLAGGAIALVSFALRFFAFPLAVRLQERWLGMVGD